MRELRVYIQINGKQTLTGYIRGNDYTDAGYLYDTGYLARASAAPISISLPLRKEPFSPSETRNFFESLLPEGFSRRAVADWIKVDEKDYLTILSELGRECIGAIKIVEGESFDRTGYELLSDDRVRELAAEGATRSTEILLATHLSLAGASGKVGLYYDTEADRWYLPKGDAPSTHIVKQSHVRLRHIVVNEQLCMMTARKLGIKVPESFIISRGSEDDEMLLYATARYDRIPSENIIDGMKSPYRIHQEDFAQALGIFAADKYEKVPSQYMAKMFELIRNHSASPIEDQQALLKSIVFNYLIGNTDCHIKNYSLLYGVDLMQKRLAPSYDLVATRVYKTTREMSFFIGGELNIEKIGRRHFEIAASEIGLSGKIVTDTLDEIANSFERALGEAAEDLSAAGFLSARSIRNEILKTGGYAEITR